MLFTRSQEKGSLLSLFVGEQSTATETLGAGADGKLGCLDAWVGHSFHGTRSVRCI